MSSLTLPIDLLDGNKHNTLISIYMEKIYKLIDPLTNQVRYIGYTSKPLYKRLAGHVRDSIRHNKTHKHHWIRTLLDNGKIPIIKLVRRIPKRSEKTWQYWENYFISKYKKLGYELTNGTDGGEGVTMTPETRAKIGLKSSLHRHSKETRKKMRKAKLGKTGVLCPNSKGVIMYNGKEELTFGSAHEAAEYLKSKGLKASKKNIGQCLVGMRDRRDHSKRVFRNQVAGYKFRRPNNGE